MRILPELIDKPPELYHIFLLENKSLSGYVAVRQGPVWAIPVGLVPLVPLVFEDRL